MPDPTLRDIRFENGRLQSLGVEALSTVELRRRVPSRLLARPERVGFFMVLVVHGGRGQHLVDFEKIALRPATVVLVRPGQVQQWRLEPGYEADVLLIEPAVLQPTQGQARQAATAQLRLAEWPSRFELDAQGLEAWRQLLAMLRREHDGDALNALSSALVHELLLCLLLGLAKFAAKSSPDTSAPARLARRFQQALDDQVMRRPTVETLASDLGVSTSTLTRTCRAKLGQAAKTLVDRRIALEAQRMLVHTDATSVSIGERLGFTEPTNFLKFFKRLVGTTPEAFRVSRRSP